MKKTLIANWKMHMTIGDAESYLASLSVVTNIDIRIAPPYTFLASIRDHAERVGVTLGGQNMCEFKEGAYTGEVSATQLKDAGAKFVILGHSERRHKFGETNKMIENKIETAVVEGLKFVLCVGETKEEKDLGKGHEVVINQLQSALSALSGQNLIESTIAYEPVWAIGSGTPATKNEIEKMHTIIREELKTMFKEDGKNVPILYGGSVSPENLPDFLSQDNVDGALVGGASLDPENFNQMIDITGEYSC